MRRITSLRPSNRGPRKTAGELRQTSAAALQAELELELATTKATVQELKEQKQTMVAAPFGRDKELDELRRDNSRLREIRQREGGARRQLVLETKLSAREKDISTRDAEIADLRKRISIAEAEVKKFGNPKIAKRLNEKIEFEKVLEDSRKTLEDNQRQQREDLETWKKEKEDLARSNREFTERLAVLESKKEDLANSNRDLIETVAVLEREKEDLANSNRNLAETVAVLESEKEDLANSKRNLAETVAVLESEKEDLANSNRDLTEAVAVLESEKEDLASSNRDLTETVAVLESEKEDLANSLTEKIAVLEAELESEQAYTTEIETSQRTKIEAMIAERKALWRKMMATLGNWFREDSDHYRLTGTFDSHSHALFSGSSDIDSQAVEEPDGGTWNGHITGEIEN